MPLLKLQTLFRSALVRAGVPPDRAAARSLYSLRRALPSGVDALEFNEADADAVGDWQGRVTADGSRRSRRSLKPMAAHYAQTAFEHAADLKRRVFVAISESVSRFNLTHDICAPGQSLGCYQ